MSHLEAFRVIDALLLHRPSTLALIAALGVAHPFHVPFVPCLSSSSRSPLGSV